MQLKLALQGKLSDVMEKHYSEGAKAVTLGITAATNGLKTSLREQVRSAGMSSRMANTWRGVVYPKGKPSITPFYAHEFHILKKLIQKIPWFIL